MSICFNQKNNLWSQLFYHWNPNKLHGIKALVLLIIYYFIGKVLTSFNYLFFLPSSKTSNVVLFDKNLFFWQVRPYHWLSFYGCCGSYPLKTWWVDKKNKQESLMSTTMLFQGSLLSSGPPQPFQKIRYTLLFII